MWKTRLRKPFRRDGDRKSKIVDVSKSRDVAAEIRAAAEKPPMPSVKNRAAEERSYLSDRRSLSTQLRNKLRYSVPLNALLGK
jgi:hypothetical protein